MHCLLQKRDRPAPCVCERICIVVTLIFSLCPLGLPVYDDTVSVRLKWVAVERVVWTSQSQNSDLDKQTLKP